MEANAIDGIATTSKSRKDSGFEDGLTVQQSPEEDRKPSSPPSQTSRSQSTHDRTQKALVTQPVISRQQSYQTSPSPRAKSRPNKARPNSSRQSSGHPSPTSTFRSSQPSSKRSLSMDSPALDAKSLDRPRMPGLSSRRTCARSYSANGYQIHQIGKQLFQSPEAADSSRREIFIDNKDISVGSNLSTPHRLSGATLPGRRDSLASSGGDQDRNGQETAPSFVPPTLIDWTSPSTRRREYEKIDRSRRGIRGLWRKIAPRWLWRSSRMSFYDDTTSDTRSVRRYRMDLPEDDEKIESEEP
ncbi:hypothetical protein MMC20_006790 [Loxospora ochrophaea]|nr:hypothetical protein [Loxospora ochrophaea]